MEEEILKRVRKAGLRRKLSPRTIGTYCTCLKKFLLYIKKEPYKTSKTDIKDYLEYLAEKNYTGKTLNVHYCAVKFLMEEVLQKRRIWIPLKFSKEQKRFPNALSKEHVILLIDAISNPQHKLMIQLMYGAGLRVSELINLKPEHIIQTYGWVRNGKNGKDRLFIIPNNIRKEIHDLKDSDNAFLFMSNRKRQYSTRTIAQICKKAAKKASIKHVHPHMLRHSFATHLIENGYDILTVQALLGHASPETTMVYAHIASPNMLQIKSPLDEFLRMP